MCKKMLLVALVLCFAGSASAALVAEWKMDEGTGQTALNSVAGGPALTWNTLNTGIGWNGSGGVQSPTNALTMDGTKYPGHEVVYAGGDSFEPYASEGVHTDSRLSDSLAFGAGSFTVSLEFKMAGAQPNSGAALFMKGDNQKRYSVMMYANGQLGMEYDPYLENDTRYNRMGKTQKYVDGTAYWDNEWHHLTATIDREELDFDGEFSVGGASPFGTAALRVDGALLFKIACDNGESWDEPRTSLQLGYAGWVSGYEFDGELDNVKFYNTAEVPEPATMSLLALGGLALLRRKK